MIYKTLKKILVTLAISGFILSSGLIGRSVSAAPAGAGQDRNWRQDRRGDRDDRRREEREELSRIRRLDREHQLRYRFDNRVRIVGYHDRWGSFHQYGYYDRFGFFHRY
jgi:hypothetical protein